MLWKSQSGKYIYSINRACLEKWISQSDSDVGSEKLWIMKILARKKVLREVWLWGQFQGNSAEKAEEVYSRNEIIKFTSFRVSNFIQWKYIMCYKEKNVCEREIQGEEDLWRKNIANINIFLVFCILVLFSLQFSHSVVSDSLWPHGLQVLF